MSNRRVNPNDLAFHPCAPVTVHDRATNQQLRVDGAWKTKAGRTLFYALSAPGSILRSPEDLQLPQLPA
jgi:hypothetical protein